jgi:multiple sugar transport system permease protein
MRRTNLQTAILYIASVAVIAITLAPFYMMVISAFSPNNLQNTYPPLRTITEATIANFELIFDPARLGFFKLLGNSLIVSVLTAAIATIIGISGGYSVARFRFPGRFAVSQFILLVYMFAGVVLVIPLFKVLLDLGLYNSRPGLVTAYLVITVPLSLYLCANYFRSLPTSVEESGLIDGCNYFNIIRYIVIPMSVPAIVTVFVFTFILCYNDYLFASVLLRDSNLFTLPIGIHRFWQDARGEAIWGAFNAAAALTSLIVLLLHGLVQHFSRKGGLSLGAEK